MNAFRYLIDRVQTLIEDVKSTNRQEFYGQRFEDWVVQWSNIDVDYYREVKVDDTDDKSNLYSLKKESCYGGYWRLLDWRGDKKHFRYGYRDIESKEGKCSEKFDIMAYSSVGPDLCLEAKANSNSWSEGDIIFVECKWSSTNRYYLTKKDILDYEVFVYNYFKRWDSSEFTGEYRSYDRLFFVFGSGWSEYNPNEAYCISAKNLYEQLNISIDRIKEQVKPDSMYKKFIPTFTSDDLKNMGAKNLVKDENGMKILYYK